MKISRTPLRFSLIGGGSDLPAYWRNYGPCKIISMTLAASMYVTLTERRLFSGSAKDTYGNNIRLSYTQTENVASIADIRHALIRETLRNTDYPNAFEMTTIGDIPSRGAGLGSSSALIVGILKLFYESMIRRDLMELAANIEISELGKNIGWQDHISAVYGGLRCYRLITISKADILQNAGIIIPALKEDDYWELWNEDMNEMGPELAKHLIAFRLPSNRSDSTEKLAQQDTLVDMQQNLEERVPFLQKTVELVDDMRDVLMNRSSIHRWAEVGRILEVAWELKKASHDYVDKNVERWYSIGKKSGALAGKVSGSMSKGCGHLFFLAYPDDHDRIRKNLVSELAEMTVEYYPHGSKVWEI